MVKLKKDYSRKKRGTAGKESKGITLIQNVFFINFLNNQNNSNEQSTSTSNSGDPFDKLLKGPSYQRCQTSFSNSCSRFGGKFFTQRQDTVSLYKSDFESSQSSSYSVALFKDSNDPTPSFQFSKSHLPSPPEYCRVQNKFAKQKTLKRNNLKLEKASCIRKRRPNVRKNKLQNKAKVPPTAASSTPTNPNTLMTNWKRMTPHFSPIFAPSNNNMMTNVSCDDMITAKKGKDVFARNSGLSVTALIEGLGNLGLATPHHGRGIEVKHCSGEEPSQFDYKLLLQDSGSVKIAEPDKEKIMESSQDEKSEGKWSQDEIEPQQFAFSSPSQVPTNKNLESGQEDLANSINIKIFNEPKNPVGSSSQVLTNKPLESDQEELEKSVISAYSLMPFNKLENSKGSSEGISSPEFIKDSSESETSANFSFNSKPDCDSIAKNSQTSSGQFKLNSPEPNLIYNVNQYSLKDLDHSNNHSEIKPNFPLSNNCLNDKDTFLNKLHSDESPIKTIGDDSQVSRHQPNLILDNSSCNYSTSVQSPVNYCKQSVPSGKENVKPENRFSILPTCVQYTKGKTSIQLSDSRCTELSDTMSLEPGKRWRRSLLRQKQSDSKFDIRRSTIGQDTLIKLIRNASISIADNESNYSCNTTARTLDGMFGNKKQKNNISLNLSSTCGSPELSLAISKFSKVYSRRRKIYKCDMLNIPEESSDHSMVKSFNGTKLCEESSDHSMVKSFNGTKLCEDSPVFQLGTGETSRIEDSDENNLSQSNIYKTPPILKMNPAVLSGITDRKQIKKRHLMTPPDWESVYSEVEASEILEENESFTSCCSKLEDETIDTFEECNIQKMGKMGVLLQCGQQAPISFSEAFPDRVLSDGQKIGEGVFGEVFMLNRPGDKTSVIKIIPVEGDQLVNGETQKHFDEVLSELIITEELSSFRNNPQYCTSGYCELKGKFCIQGEYPPQLLNLWYEYHKKKRSENDCPDMFGPEQLYIVLELEHAGEPVESFKFRSPKEAFSVFLQTTFSLAVAESAVEFEHRDLHIGNVLVRTTSEKYIPYKINGLSIDCPSYGLRATIIDYTLSRISFKDDVLYFDLEKDPELFTATGDYQFDIYRLMRDDLDKKWREHNSKTNVRWLHYLIDKFVTVIKYRQRKTKTFTEFMDKMKELKEMIIDFYSATDLADHLSQSYYQTMSLIRTN